MNPSEGVVLGSVGVGGAYDVGVLLALAEGAGGQPPVDPGVLKGGSTGAFSGAFLAANARNPERPGEFLSQVRELAGIWREEVPRHPDTDQAGIYRMRGCDLVHLVKGDGKSSTWVTDIIGDATALATGAFRKTVGLLSSDTPLSIRALKFLNLADLVMDQGYSDLLARWIDLERLRTSPRQFRCTAVNGDTGKMRYFSNGDFTDWAGHRILRACGAVPCMFHNVDLAECDYLDACLVERNKLAPVVEAGATTIHLITKPPLFRPAHEETHHSTTDAIYRALVLAWEAMFHDDLDFARNVNEILCVARQEIQATGLTPEEKTMALQIVSDALREGRGIRTSAMEQLTIHRYHRAEVLDRGFTAMLDAQPEALKRAIEIGYEEGVRHDCEERGCILPVTSTERPASLARLASEAGSAPGT